MLRMSGQLVDRLESATLQRNLVAAPRTLALVPVDPTAPTAWLAGAINRTLVDAGAKTRVLNERMDKSVLDRVEMAHDLTLYHCAAADPLSTSAAIDTAHRIFFVASAATNAPTPPAFPHTPPSRRTPALAAG